MNSAVELHDSEVAEISTSKDVIVVRLSPAIIHRSTGQPGVDPGSVWLANVDVSISDFKLESETLIFPQTLDGGRLEWDSTVTENVIPLSLDRHGMIRFCLQTFAAEQFIIQGSAVTIAQSGEPRYLEQFQ